jgi:hypothetical protein
MTAPLFPAPIGLLSAEFKREVRKLADELDKLVECTDWMDHAREALLEAPSDPAKLENAKSVLARYRASAIRNDLVSGKLKAMHEALMAALPECKWWTDDFKEVRSSAIMQVISVFVASFSQGVANPEIFTSEMIDDVVSWHPHPFSIVEALRGLRHIHKKPPPTSEVHAAYKAASERRNERWDAEKGAEYIADELAKLIERSEERSTP